MSGRGKRHTNKFTPLYRRVLRPSDPDGAGSGTMVPGSADVNGFTWNHLTVYNIEDPIDPASPQYPVGGVLTNDPLVIPDLAPESQEALLAAAAFGYGYTGVGWTRSFSYGNDSDNIASRADGFPANLSFNMGYDGANWDRFRIGVNNADNITPLALGVLQTASYLYGFDGANFDRIRSGGTDADNVAALAAGALQAAAYSYVWDNVGGNWDRWTGSISITGPITGGTADNADNVAVTANAALRTTAELYGFDGATWDRIRSVANDSDNVASLALGVLPTASYTYLYDGATWDRQTSKNFSADVNVSGANTDRSTTITVGGTSQQLMAANPSRKFFYCQNLSTTLNLGIRFGAGSAAIGTANTVTIPPLESVSLPITDAIQIVGPNAGQSFTSGEV